MALSLFTAKMIIFAFYMEFGSGVTGKLPKYVAGMMMALAHLDTIQKIEASLPADIGRKWSNYKLLWPHEDM